MSDAFLSNYIPVPESGCWLWLGGTSRHGYGQLGGHRKNVLAHRAFYVAHKGEMPAGVCVCHKCDTPLCVNPDHMFLGTQKDNAIDRERKNRGRHRAHADHRRPIRAKHKPAPSPGAAGGGK